MSGSTLNLTKLLKKQGLDPRMHYEAHVVDNNDPRKLGRIRARIDLIFDGIPDDALPWAIPRFQHADGAYNPGGDALDRSGTFMVPKVKHKVSLKFPDADPHRPVWGPYTVDEQVSLPETLKNYPNRAVLKFDNGMYIIVDTTTNEVFFNNAGDLDVTILGDVNQYIVGNQQLIVTGSKGDIDPYLLNAPDTVLSRLKPQPTKNCEFRGLLAKGNAGYRHIHVTGDQTMMVDGNRLTVIKGNDTVRVMQNRLVKVDGLHRIECARSEQNG